MKHKNIEAGLSFLVKAQLIRRMFLEVKPISQ